jgi:hypothetical protein
MGRRDWSQRSTLYDLYVERDAITWYFRILATAGTWLILAGYILFTFAAASNPKDLVAEKTTLIVAGTAVIVIGHILTVLTYIPFRHKLAVSLRCGTDPHLVIFVDRIPSYPSTPGDSPECVFWSTASLPTSPVRYVGNRCLCLPRPLDASMYTTSQGFG